MPANTKRTKGQDFRFFLRTKVTKFSTPNREGGGRKIETERTFHERHRWRVSDLESTETYVLVVHKYTAAPAPPQLIRTPQQDKGRSLLRGYEPGCAPGDRAARPFFSHSRFLWFVQRMFAFEALVLQELSSPIDHDRKFTIVMP
jgi:hypothetical protein